MSDMNSLKAVNTDSNLQQEHDISGKMIQSRTWHEEVPVDWSLPSARQFRKLFMQAYSQEEIRIISSDLGFDCSKVDFSGPANIAVHRFLDAIANAGRLKEVIVRFIADPNKFGFQKAVLSTLPPIAVRSPADASVMQVVIVLDGGPNDLEDIKSNLLGAIQKLVKRKGVRLKKVEFGSVKVTLEGPADTLLVLKYLVDNGFLLTLLGREVIKVYEPSAVGERSPSLITTESDISGSSTHSLPTETDLEHSDEVAAKFKVGDRVKGRVVSVRKHSIFVDLGGIVGRIQRTELSHKRGARPQSVTKVGEEIEAIVLRIDPPRPSKSRKQAAKEDTPTNAKPAPEDSSTENEHMLETKGVKPAETGKKKRGDRKGKKPQVLSRIPAGGPRVELSRKAIVVDPQGGRIKYA